MKNALLFTGILIAVCLASCNMPTNNTSVNSTTASVHNTRLQNFLLDWINDNPQWENNQVVKEETDAKFLAAYIDSMHHYNMLEDIPFTLEQVGKYKNKYTVLLKHDAYKWGMLNPRIWCGVIGYVSREDVEKLTEGNEYRFTGKFKSVVLDRSDYFPHSTVLGDLKVGKDGETMHLATSIIDIDSIWCVKKK
ncbi:MAG: hypothetical protein K6D59_02960 [Bacteroidales bacterium]|nr:hypothetical protein [Bacteroidales bacterium]